MKRTIAFLLVFLALASVVSSHSGGLDANGGHWDRKAGTYHYHRAPPPATTTTTTTISPEAGPEISAVVYITKTGEKYHLGTCSYLRYSKIEITKKDAVARGLTPCSVCRP